MQVSLPHQPSLAAYSLTNHNYELFIAFCVFVAVLPVILLYQTGKNKQAGIIFSLPLSVIIILGFALRLPLFLHKFWYDEAFTSAVVQTTNSGFFAAIMGDVHPPLYYLIVRFFTHFLGHSDFVMRIPALLSSLAIIPVMYLIGKEHESKRVGTYAALLAAIMPQFVYYGTEARYPAFLCLMLAIAYLGLERKQTALFVIGLSLAALTHVNAWFAVAIMIGLRIWREPTRQSIVFCSVPVFFIGLWLPVALQQSADVSNGFWLELYQPYRHLIEMSIGDKFQNVHNAYIAYTLVSVALGVSLLYWKKRATFAWLALVVLFPVIQWIVSLAWHPIYLPRTLLISIALLFIPIGYWIAHHARKITLILFLISIGIGNFASYMLDRDNIGGDAIEMCEGYSVIFATNTHTAILAKHHSEASVIVWTGGNSSAQALPDSSRAALFDGIGDIFKMSNHENTCIVSQFSPYNTAAEVLYLEMIRTSLPYDLSIVEMEETDQLYYLVFRGRR